MQINTMILAKHFSCGSSCDVQYWWLWFRLYVEISYGK
jgi:hypothetical protein